MAVAVRVSGGDRFAKKKFLNSILKILCHRCCNLTKLPWQLSKQPWEDRDDPSGAGTDPFFKIHCIWYWSRFHLCLRPPDNHGRWRDNLDGEELRHHPSCRHNQHKQHRQAGVQYWWQWCKTWLECQLERSDTRWVSTTCLDIPGSFFQFVVPHNNGWWCSEYLRSSNWLCCLDKRAKNRAKANYQCWNRFVFICHFNVEFFGIVCPHIL